MRQPDRCRPRHSRRSPGPRPSRSTQRPPRSRPSRAWRTRRLSLAAARGAAPLLLLLAGRWEPQGWRGPRRARCCGCPCAAAVAGGEAHGCVDSVVAVAQVGGPQHGQGQRVRQPAIGTRVADGDLQGRRQEEGRGRLRARPRPPPPLPPHLRQGPVRARPRSRPGRSGSAPWRHRRTRRSHPHTAAGRARGAGARARARRSRGWRASTVETVRSASGRTVTSKDPSAPIAAPGSSTNGAAAVVCQTARGRPEGACLGQARPAAAHHRV